MINALVNNDLYDFIMKTIPKKNIDKEIFKTIFIDHWDLFKQKYSKYDNPQYTIPVQKMLDCGKESGGYTEYRCVHCGGDLFRVGFSCKSCFCCSSQEIKNRDNDYYTNSWTFRTL